jgi:hypothetical protein
LRDLNGQWEADNTEHTVLKKTMKHTKRRETPRRFFCLFVFGNRLSFPENEEDISKVKEKRKKKKGKKNTISTLCFTN